MRRRLAVLLLACVACSDGPAPAPTGGACHERVIFVLVDALRRDHLGFAGYARPTSPTLDRLAGEGLLLSNVVASSSHTVPSVLTLLTSLLPSEHGIQYWSRWQSFSPDDEKTFPSVPDGLTLLPEIFAAAGFATAAVVANPWLTRTHGFAQGFGEYVELQSRDGEMINAEARRLLAEHAHRPLFLYLHYLDVHNPYTGPDRGELPFRLPEGGELVYRNGLAPDLDARSLKLTEAMYDARIVYMDGHVAELMDFVAREGLDCDTTWLVTSDHGDEFHEHGGLGHGTTLYNELLNVFAIFWNPKRFAPRRIERKVHARDVLPTLLRAHGLAPPPSAGGRSVHAPPGAAPPPAPQGADALLAAELADRKAVIRGEWKLIVDLDEPRERFFHVGPTGDIEGVAAEPDDPETAALLRADLARLRAMEPLIESTRRVDLDPERQRELRELGYLE